MYSDEPSVSKNVETDRSFEHFIKYTLPMGIIQIRDAGEYLKCDCLGCNSSVARECQMPIGCRCNASSNRRLIGAVNKVDSFLPFYVRVRTIYLVFKKSSIVMT